MAELPLSAGHLILPSRWRLLLKGNSLMRKPEKGSLQSDSCSSWRGLSKRRATACRIEHSVLDRDITKIGGTTSGPVLDSAQTIPTPSNQCEGPADSARRTLRKVEAAALETQGLAIAPARESEVAYRAPINCQRSIPDLDRAECKFLVRGRRRTDVALLRAIVTRERIRRGFLRLMMHSRLRDE